MPSSSAFLLCNPVLLYKGKELLCFFLVVGQTQDGGRIDRCNEVAELDKRVEDRGVGDGVEHAGSTWRGNGSITLQWTWAFTYIHRLKHATK